MGDVRWDGWVWVGEWLVVGGVCVCVGGGGVVVVVVVIRVVVVGVVVGCVGVMVL